MNTQRIIDKPVADILIYILLNFNDIIMLINKAKVICT